MGMRATAVRGRTQLTLSGWHSKPVSIEKSPISFSGTSLTLDCPRRIVAMEVEREYSVRLGICLTLLRKINQARRLGEWARAKALLKELHLLEGREVP